MSLPVVKITLEGACAGADGCKELAETTYGQLSGGGYHTPCSVFPVPASIDDWLAEHGTARRRANACERKGFEFREIHRADFELDIHRINTSAPERQGRPMSEGYTKRQSHAPLPPQPCPRHRISEYGVVVADTLLAYLVAYRVGALVLVSQLLGHDKYLDEGIMYLLFRGVLARQIEQGPGFMFYNRHDSGTPGLRFYKERLGFEPTTIEWHLT